jgi:hypothetical protein
VTKACTDCLDAEAKTKDSPEMIAAKYGYPGTVASPGQQTQTPRMLCETDSDPFGFRRNEHEVDCLTEVEIAGAAGSSQAD